MAEIVNTAHINDLIFRELIKRGYSLEGNTRVWNIADSKLWYLTPEQAQAYLDMEHDEKYADAVGEKFGKDLTEARAKEVIEWTEGAPINVVDLGCGDGKKAAGLIKAFGGNLKVRYCPIDISGYMVKKARDTFRSENVAEVVDFQYNISDFENLDNIIPLLSSEGYKRNLFLLLGNTLGNFEIHELLYEIRNSMSGNDMLVIDTAIETKDVFKIADMHSKNEVANRFFRMTLLQLGIREDNLEYGVCFKNHRIEVYYTIKKDQVIEFNNKKVVFNKGDRVIVAVAYKYEEKDLLSYLNLYFGSVSAHFSDDRGKVVALCKK